MDWLPGYSLALWADSNKPSLISNPESKSQTLTAANSKAVGLASSGVPADGSKQLKIVSLNGNRTSGTLMTGAINAIGENVVVESASRFSSYVLLTQGLLAIVRAIYVVELLVTVSWLVLGWLARRRIVLASLQASNQVRYRIAEHRWQESRSSEVAYKRPCFRADHVGNSPAYHCDFYEAR